MNSLSKCALIKCRVAEFVLNSQHSLRESWQRITSQEQISELKCSLNKHYCYHPLKKSMNFCVEGSVLKCNINGKEGLVSPIIIVTNMCMALTFATSYSNWRMENLDIKQLSGFSRGPKLECGRTRNGTKFCLSSITRILHLPIALRQP